MFRQLQRFFENSGMLARVIAINVAVFLLVNLVYIIVDNFEIGGFYLTVGSRPIPKLIYWLSAPSNLLFLAIRPWTWFTYMFLHEDIWHILFNMVMLYFSGRIFCDMLNDRRFLPVYIFGGLCGLAFFVIGYNVFPRLYTEHGGILYGASASVMAVFVATATYLPEYEVYLFGVFRMKLKWLAIIYVALDFVAVRGFDNVGGHLSHLGGAVFGFIYARRLASGSDWSEGFNRLSDWFSTLFKPSRKVKVVHRSGDFGKPQQPSKSDRQKEIDAILDKISRTGYDSLTKDEKETLLKASEE